MFKSEFILSRDAQRLSSDMKQTSQKIQLQDHRFETRDTLPSLSLAKGFAPVLGIYVSL